MHLTHKTRINTRDSNTLVVQQMRHVEALQQRNKVVLRAPYPMRAKVHAITQAAADGARATTDTVTRLQHKDGQVAAAA